MKLRTNKASTRHTTRRRILLLLAGGLCTIFLAVELMNLETPRRASQAREVLPTNKRHARGDHSRIQSSTSSSATVSTAARAASIPFGSVTVTPADISALSIKNLLIPVQGITSGSLRDSFNDSRSEGRTHRALDIMAPRDTPVLATDDGKVLRLHQSDRGGIMLYQCDASGIYVYFYGHLTRYADGISEGKPVRRGEIIAFVGDTGNAGPGNYHLHFGISKMTEGGKWSGGEPINPYPLLTPVTPSIGAGK